MRFAIRLMMISVLLGCILPAAFAQESTGAISGEITDSSHADVPQVEVTVTNVNTGVVWKAETNSLGIYVFEYLPPGEYQLAVSKVGFTPVLLKGIVLQVAQRARQDVQLQVGSEVQSVQVVAQAEQALNPASAELGEVITTNSIQELPLNGRSFLTLVPLTAGVSPGTPGVFQSLIGLPFSVEGLRQNSSSYVVDGFDNNNFNINTPWDILPADSIQEFALLTNNFSAEYGRAAGGVVNMIVRSGTNGLHGTLFEFLRNDKLDANDFFSNAAGAPKTPLRYNQFGGSLGGPIAHNKTFFFVDYQGTRNNSSSPVIASVPPVAWRTGDFSSLLAQGITIYDPNSTSGPSTGRTAFPGNMIPPSEQDPAALKLLALYPTPNMPGDFNNYFTTQAHTSPEDQVDVKLDHNFSERDRLSVRYDFDDSSLTNTPILGPAGEGGGISGTSRDQQLAGIYTRTLSPQLVNEFRLDWMRTTVADTPPGYGSNLDTQVGIPGINTGTPSSGLAWVCSAGYNCLGGDPGFPVVIQPQTSIEVADNLSLVHGRHSIKIGYSVIPRWLDLLQPLFPRGLFLFDALFTSQGGVGGNAVASELTGYYFFTERDILNHFMDITDLEMGTFVQDNFRVNRKLTLNLGLRWDMFTPQVEAQNRQSNFDPATVSMLLAGQNGNSRALVNTDKKDFQPRFGLAYSATDKTVIRGGYGISYIPERDSVAQNRISYNPPFYFFQAFAENEFEAPTSPISAGLPAPVAPDPAHPTGTIEYQQPNMRNASVQYWNLDIQRALTSTLVLDVAYAGNHGTHLLTMRDINQTAPGPVQVYPYPGIGDLFAFEGRGNSLYDGLQVKAEKRLSYGLSFRAAYTYSKAINDSPGFWPVNSGDRIPQNSYDYDAERGLAENDIRHRFVISYDWELPIGQGKPFLNSAGTVMNQIIGGWQITGIATAQSGFPFTPTISVNPSNSAFGGTPRPDRICSGTLSNPTVADWFNTSCFTVPALYTFGNSGRDILIGPKFVDFDFGFFKNFKVTDKIRLQFRSEFFNLFNHPQFATPNTDIDLPSGGTITGLAGTPREIQFALKFIF